MSNRANVAAEDFTLAQKLRERRERLGLSQTEVATLISDAGIRMSQTAMSRIEKGERALTVGEALVYASALQTTLEELLSSDKIDEIIADGLATLRALETSRRGAMKSLHEHWEQMRQLRRILLDAFDLQEDAATSDAQRERLTTQLIDRAIVQDPDAHEDAELRIARALDALEKSTINEMIITVEGGRYNL
ncbi:helix-turn-helix transcriptional regulator [Leucobacter chironomi]|uniref:helix-turn-helix transcriptional regulator n=1 Tax=Leucobacter chironomi TaxID=491918 RepID=UPI00097594DE|nr:helix-turn-helix domain-containing protein [Leucobacter chironomi]